jgi:hypothetical protein
MRRGGQMFIYPDFIHQVFIHPVFINRDSSGVRGQSRERG